MANLCCSLWIKLPPPAQSEMFDAAECVLNFLHYFKQDFLRNLSNFFPYHKWYLQYRNKLFPYSCPSSLQILWKLLATEELLWPMEQCPIVIPFRTFSQVWGPSPVGGARTPHLCSGRSGSGWSGLQICYAPLCYDHKQHWLSCLYYPLKCFQELVINTLCNASLSESVQKTAI